MDWAIIGAVLLPTVVVLGMWIDSRRRSDANHTENRERLVRIETKLEPMWEWWSKNGNGDH